MPEFSSFIADGYERPGYISPVALKHSGLRFSYRPMVQVQRLRFWKGVNAAGESTDPGLAEELSAKGVAPQIKSWDLKDASGLMLPMSPENLLRVEPDILRRLAMIVTGAGLTDIDPLWPEKDATDAKASEAADVKN